jgi:hypothetical protein
MSNDLQMTKQKTRLEVANGIIAVIEKFSEARALELDNYQKTCGVNALNFVANTLVDDISVDLSRENVISVVQNLMFLRLNVANGEVALITRNSKKGKILEMQVMGTGYDALLRNFGLNINKVHNAWLIRENDTYVPSEYVGLKRTEPIWKLGGKDKKERGRLIKVVYPIELEDGTVEYLEGEREDVKISLIAQAKQNMMRAKDKKEAENILRQMEELDLDELLGNPEWRDKEVVTKVYDNGKFVDGATKIFNDTYTGFSRENMIERKMRNHAIRKYPKNLDNVYVREAYESTYEEERYNKPMNDNILEHTQGALETETQEKANSIVVEELEKEVVEPVIIQETKSTENDRKVENQPKTVEPITVEAEPVSTIDEIDKDLDDYFE